MAGMTDSAWLTNHCLIAMPQLPDPRFAGTVTYLCEHDQEGAFGLTINRPLDLSAGELLAQAGVEGSTEGLDQEPVLLGGPVEPQRGFVLHLGDGHWQHTLKFANGLRLTTSKDILQAIAHGHGPRQRLLLLGYAGWGAGQLEQEMRENSWLSTPSDPFLMFETPWSNRWTEAARRLGIDPSQLADYGGHA
jgi:putative transcriptional regulator